MDKDDATRIWKHFQRFADYEDLKELYQKCIPELAKFEVKMIDYSDQIEQCKQIIEHFDKVMTEKANKASVKEVYEFIEKNCASPQEHLAFKEEILKQFDNMNTRIDRQANMLDMVERSFNLQIQKEINNLTMDLTQSNIELSAIGAEGISSKASGPI